MASSNFEALVLPEPIYGMGFEPIVGANICQHSDLSLVAKVKHALGKASFTKLQSSFLGPIINLSARDIKFSGKLFHYVMLRRLKTRGRNLWFTVDMQPLRFSMREFFLTTGIQCKPIHREPRNNRKDPISEPYSWAVRGDYTLTQLQYRLFNEPEEGEEPLDDKEKECLAAVVLTEGILMTPYSLEKIPLSRLKHASDFEMYTAQPWGKEAYNILATCIQKFDKDSWSKGQYSVKGFPMALYIWALSAVPIFGDTFARRCNFSRTFYPLILNWQSSRYTKFDDIVEAIKKATCVEVKTIIGDPQEYKHLVDKDDNDFEEVIGLVMKGYRLKKEEWSSRLVDIYYALGELGDKMGEKLPVFEKHEKMEKNLSDSEKLDIILFMLDDFNKRLEAIEEAVKTTSGEDKDKGSHEDEDGQNRNEEVINEEAGKQNVDGDIAREDFVESQSADSVRPSNTQDGSYAADDENTQKTGGDDGNYFEETPKDKSPSPRPSTPKFDLLSEEDEVSEKDKSMDKEKGASSKKRGLRERKQRKCKQSNDGDDDVMNRKERKKRKPSDNPDADIQAREGPQKKKSKSDDVGGVQRKSERNTIPSIHTQPPYTAEKKKDPILYPFSKVDKTRLDVFSDWKTSRKTKATNNSG
ncbi:PREDICTED: uncharacterized protein LOC104789090 [Camelina sativa]|uniref:Uncharacterized protein LOC104789090 n=1 Tax=Camelina sativa TaxID=90675 RepID=A0ABM0ZB93_CAMSA|nr:PREDICTED: uncharacterized protein LOC104789090 [Camelina sativa]